MVSNSQSEGEENSFVEFRRRVNCRFIVEKEERHDGHSLLSVRPTRPQRIG